MPRTGRAPFRAAKGTEIGMSPLHFSPLHFSGLSIRSGTMGCAQLPFAGYRRLMYRVIPYNALHRGAQMKDQRRLLLVIAWLMFVASLPAPGVDQQIPVLGRLPLGLLLVVVVPAGAFYGHGGWFLPTAFSTILFLLSPWAANLSGVRPFALRMLVAIGLLGAWAYPIGFYIILRPHGRAGQDGYAAPLWGYYLFTAACTLACAISLMGSCDRHHDDRGGFPVVANTDQGGGG